MVVLSERAQFRPMWGSRENSPGGSELLRPRIFYYKTRLVVSCSASSWQEHPPHKIQMILCRMVYDTKYSPQEKAFQGIRARSCKD